jgi:hypothetical protein
MGNGFDSVCDGGERTILHGWGVCVLLDLTCCRGAFQLGQKYPEKKSPDTVAQFSPA